MHRPACRALPNISFNHPPHTLRAYFTPKTKPTAKVMLLAPAVGFTVYICI